MTEAEYHKDFRIEHLERGNKTLAKNIRTWLDKKSDGGLRVNGDLNSGCRLFSNTIHCETYAKNDLYLIFDGGTLHSLLSCDGDGHYYNCSWEWPLKDYIKSLGYEIETLNGYSWRIAKYI